MVSTTDIRSPDLHDDIPSSEKDRVSEYNAHYRDIKEAVEADFRNVSGLPDASIWRYDQRLSGFSTKTLVLLVVVISPITLLISVMLANTWILVVAPVVIFTATITFMIYNHKKVTGVKSKYSKLPQKYIDIMNRRLELRPSYMPPVIAPHSHRKELTLNDVFELYCDYRDTVLMDIPKPSDQYSVPLTIYDTSSNNTEVISTIRYQDPQSIFFECDDGRQGMIDLKTKKVFSPHFQYFYLSVGDKL